MASLNDYLFDGSLLLGPHAGLNHSYWHSLRHNMMGAIQGAFHKTAGAWPGTRALILEKGDASVTNLITNPSFETNTTGWAAVGGSTTIAQDDEFTRYGNYALKVAPDSGVWSGVDYDITLVASTDYTASIWFNGPPGQSYFLALYDNTGSVNRILQTFTATGEWQRIHGHGTTADSTDHTLRVRKNNHAGVGAFFVDGVQLEARNSLTTHCDGDQGHSYSWTGTEHASTSKRVTSYVDLSSHAALLQSQDKLSIRTVLQAPLDADDANWPESTFNYVFNVRDTSTNARIAVYYNPSVDKFIAAISDGTDTVTLTPSSAHTFKAGDWMDLTVTVDYNATGAGSYKLYLNGTEVDSSTGNNVASFTGVTHWTLGSYYLGTYQGGWAIAEHAVWQDVITNLSALAELRYPLVDVYATRLPYRPTWREENVRDGYDVVIPDNAVYWAWAAKKNVGDSDPVYGAYTLAGIQGAVAQEGLVMVEWCDGGPKTICGFKWAKGNIAWDFDPGAGGIDVTISSTKDLTIKTTGSNDIVIQATGSGGDTKIEAARRMHVHGKKVQITANSTYDWAAMSNGDLVLKADDGIYITNTAGDQDENIVIASGQNVIIGVGDANPSQSAADYIAVDAQLRLYNVYGNPNSPQTGAIWYNTATDDLWFKGPTYFYKIDMTRQ